VCSSDLTKEEAMRREYEIKKMPRGKKLELMALEVEKVPCQF